MQKLQIIWIEAIVRLRTSTQTPNECCVSTCISLLQMWSSESLFWSDIGSIQSWRQHNLAAFALSWGKHSSYIAVVVSVIRVVSLSFDRRESTDVATTMKWVSLKLKFANAFELKKTKTTKISNENEPECLLAQSADIAHTILRQMPLDFRWS